LFALRAGAAGFVTKAAPLAELVTAIRTAAAGGLHFAWLDLPINESAVADSPT
jgi:DNA-binding NarL/FixJ family response regulator